MTNVKRYIVLAVAILTAALCGVMLAGAAAPAYTVRADSGYGITATYLQGTFVGQSSGKLVSKKAELRVTDTLLNEFESSKYNHFVMCYGRADMIEYVRGKYDTGSNIGADDISLNSEYFDYTGNSNGEPAYAFAALKEADKTGTFGYEEFGKGSAVGGYFPRTFEWGENDKTYDIGFFALYYYSTILSTDVRAKSEVKTIKKKDELNARLKDDNYVARYEDFEKVLGIYREGKTAVKVNYLAMTGFNTYETRTYETDISAYLVPNENMVKERVLTAFGAEETGIAAFNAVYTPTSLFVMESGEYGSAEVFGSRIIRAATGLQSNYDGEEIPEELTVTVIYSEYSYKDFCLQIKNNNKDMPNSLYLDFYPAETKALDGYVTLVFDYEKIFTLFGTTFNWSGYPADFTVNVPEEYSEKVKISEEKTGRKGVDPDGKEFDYKKLTVKVKESEQSELFGIPITGTANITKPVELNVTLVYETLDENLKTAEKSISLGKRFDNTFGTLSAEIKSKNGAYASFVYGGISPEVLGATEYMKVADVKYTVNYKEQTATFRVEYGFNTVFAIRLGEKISAVRLAKSCTAEELFIPIPDGFRIKKIYGDNTGRAVMKENAENPLKNKISYSGSTSLKEPIYFDLELTDEWTLSVNYLTQYKNSPFAVLNTKELAVKVNDFPDIYKLTPEEVTGLVGTDISVLKMKENAVMAEEAVVVFNGVSGYTVNLKYSVITVVTKDSDGNNSYLNVGITSFSIWRERFGEDWTLTYIAPEVFKFSQEVKYDKLYGFFALATFSEQVRNFNSWFKEFTSAGCSVIFNKAEVTGSGLYRFARENASSLIVGGAATGAVLGMFCGAPLVGAIVGAGAGALFSLTTSLLSEMANDENAKYYTYFFYLDGTTDGAYVAHNGADDVSDNDSAITNKGEDILDRVTKSELGKAIGIILGVTAAVVIVLLFIRIILWLFPKKPKER